MEKNKKKALTGKGNTENGKEQQENSSNMKGQVEKWKRITITQL
jgi:hypothetical protein